MNITIKMDIIIEKYLFVKEFTIDPDCKKYIFKLLFCSYFDIIVFTNDLFKEDDINFIDLCLTSHLNRGLFHPITYCFTDPLYFCSDYYDNNIGYLLSINPDKILLVGSITKIIQHIESLNILNMITPHLSSFSQGHKCYGKIDALQDNEVERIKKNIKSTALVQYSNQLISRKYNILYDLMIYIFWHWFERPIFSFEWDPVVNNNGTIVFRTKYHVFDDFSCDSLDENDYPYQVCSKPTDLDSCWDYLTNNGYQIKINPSLKYT